MLSNFSSCQTSTLQKILNKITQATTTKFDDKLAIEEQDEEDPSIFSATSYENNSVFINCDKIKNFKTDAQVAFILAHEDTHFLINNILRPNHLGTDNAITKFGLDSLLPKSMPEPFRKEYLADIVGCRILKKAGFDDPKKTALDTFDITEKTMPTYCKSGNEHPSCEDRKTVLNSALSNQSIIQKIDSFINTPDSGSL